MPCKKQQGACSYCGRAGACCKRGYEGAPAECGLGSRGCAENHCCTSSAPAAPPLPPFQPPPSVPPSPALPTSPLPPPWRLQAHAKLPAASAASLAPPPGASAPVTFSLSPEMITGITIGATFGCALLLFLACTLGCWLWRRQRKYRDLLHRLKSDLRRLKAGGGGGGGGSSSSRHADSYRAVERGLLSPSPTPTPSPRAIPEEALSKEEEEERLRQEEERLKHHAAQLAIAEAAERQVLARERSAAAKEEAAMLAAEEAALAAEEAAFEAELAASARAGLAAGSLAAGTAAGPAGAGLGGVASPVLGPASPCYGTGYHPGMDPRVRAMYAAGMPPQQRSPPASYAPGSFTPPGGYSQQGGFSGRWSPASLLPSALWGVQQRQPVPTIRRTVYHNAQPGQPPPAQQR